MKGKPKNVALKVCILSPHPLVLAEFSRVLAGPGFHLISRQLDSMLGPDLRRLVVPSALVYVVDAHASQPATAALLANILEHHQNARLLVVADKFNSNDSHNLLRLGAKGLLTYDEARDQLPRALPLVASGGFWVPRNLLSEFVDSILTNARGRQLKVETATQLSPRPRGSLTLLENLANKESPHKQTQPLRADSGPLFHLLGKIPVGGPAALFLSFFPRPPGGPG